MSEQRCVITQRALAEILYTSYLKVLWTGLEMPASAHMPFSDQPIRVQEIWMGRADKAMQSIAKGEI